MSKKKKPVKKAAKKPFFTPKTILIAAVALLLVIAGLLLAVYLPGLIRRRRTVASYRYETADGQVEEKLTGAMYSYFFYHDYETMLTGQNAAAYKAAGLSFAIDPKTVPYSDTRSWFDLMEPTIREHLRSVLCFAESAREEGLSVDPAAVEARMDELMMKAVASGLKFNDYLDSNYGKGVRENDVRAVTELLLLADLRAEKLREGISITDDEIAAYAGEHPEKLMRADLCFYILTPSENAPAPEKAAIREKADELGSCNTLELFSAWVRAYENERAAAEGSAALTEDEWADVYHDFYYENVEYERALALDEHYLDRQPGETVITVDENTGSCGVLLALTPLQLDETPGYNLQIAAFTNENAPAFVEEMLANGEFADPATAFETACTAQKGVVSTLENAPLADSGLPAEAVAWLESGPTAGETYRFSQSGVGYLLCYRGKGLLGWQTAARTNLFNAKNHALEQALLDEYSPKITLSDRIADSIAARG